MTTNEYPPKNPSKKQLLEMALKLKEESDLRKQKIAEMEAEKAKALSGKENKDEELRSEYYDKALEIITRTGNTTFSNLMRKLKISVTKAKRLLEMLEQDGILGPSIKGSPREILKNKVSGEEKKNIEEKLREQLAPFEKGKITQDNPEGRAYRVIESPIDKGDYYLVLLEPIMNPGETRGKEMHERLHLIKSKTTGLIERGYMTGDWINKLDENNNEIENDDKEKPETDEEKARRKSEELKAELEAKENADKGKEGSKYNFNWTEEKGYADLAYTYEKGTYVFEISGKETEVVIHEKKTVLKKLSLLWKVIRANFKEKKEVLNEKSKWRVYLSTYNEELYEKYPKELEFDTKEEAIKQAEKIIDEGLKINDKEEKEFMGINDPEPTPEPGVTPLATTPEPAPVSPTPTSPEPTPPLALEKIIFYENVLKAKDEEFKNRLKDGNLSEKMRGGVLKALDKWENFGKNEKGTKGFAKRMGKNAINLALIGIVSSFAVEKLAEAGTGTAAALGGGTFSYLGRKMAIGLGFSSTFEGISKSLSSENNSRGVKIAKKAMPYILGIASVSASVFLTGGMVGAAAGLGTASTMLMRHWYASEKIEKREENAKQKLLDKIRASGEEIDISQVKIYEDEYLKILKKYENQKLRGRLLVGIAKIGIGSLVSGLTLEASGAHMQANIDEHNKEIAEAQSEHEEAVQRLDELKKEHEESLERLDALDKQHEQSVADLKHQTELKEQQAEQENTEAKADQSKPDDSNQTSEKDQTQESQNKSEVKLENIIVHKGEGIEHSFIRQIEGNPELAKELGYKGEADDTKALHEFAGRQAHVIAIKTGYVDNQGHEIRIAEADKVGYEIKMENGHVSVIERTSTDEVVETHNEGDKFEDKIEKGEYVKDFGQKTNTETVAGSDAHNSPIDTPHITEHSGNMFDSGNSDLKNNTESLAGLGVHNTPIDTPHITEHHGEHSAGEQNHALGDTGKTVSGESDSGNVNIERDLTPTEMEQVKEVYDNNINHLFGGRLEDEWNSVQKNVPADRLLELYNKGEVESYIKPLVHHIMKLEEVTGLRPYSYDPIDHPLGPEKIPVFIDRALEEAARIGKLDEVTL